MKNIVLDGVEYRLVPVTVPETPQNRLQEEVGTKKTILDEYVSESNENVAIPKISDYRERFKEHKVYLSDVSTPSKALKTLPRNDGLMDQFGGLVVGNGLEQEI